MTKFRLPDLNPREEPQVANSETRLELVFGFDGGLEDGIGSSPVEEIGKGGGRIMGPETPQRSPENSVTSLLPMSLSQASTETESQFGLLSLSGTTTNGSWTTGATSITTSSRSYCVSPQEEPAPSREIRDLCSEIRLLEERDPSQKCAEQLGTIAASDVQKYRLTSQKGCDSLIATGMASLDEVVGNEHLRLTRRNRLSLAVKLSVGILQLASTPWVDYHWSWADLSIAGFDMQHLDKASLFIARHFYSTLNDPKTVAKRAQDVPSLIDFVPGNKTLLKLGCALVELAFGRRLSTVSQYTQIGGKDPFFGEVLAAKAILNSGRLNDEEGEVYHQVVETCLGQEIPEENGQGMKSLNVHDSHFQQDISRAIIEPLCSIWNSHRESRRW